MQRRMQRRRAAGAAARSLLAAIIVVSTACGSTGPGTAPSPGPSIAPVPDTTPPTSPPSTPEGERTLPLPPVDPDAPHPFDCDAVRRTAMRSPVTAQLDALVDEDFALAYAMTSPFFQRVLAADAFESLIRGQYPELIGNGGHRFDECRVRGRRGHLVVGVRDGVREVVLRYDLSEEAEGWRIDGAMRLTLTLPPQPLA